MKHIHNILYSLLLIVGLTSCVTDSVLDNCPNEGGNNGTANAQVMLSLSIPNTQLPSNTRVAGESTINSLWILEFEKNVLIEKVNITDKYNNANGDPFYATVKETEGEVSLSVVANQDVSTLSIGELKKDILKSLTFTNANSLNYIPMYGESEVFVKFSRENSYNTNISLTRALAKIEVQYSSTQTEEEFTFLGIEVLNSNANGYTAINEIPTQTRVESIAVSPSGNQQLKTASVYIAETTNSPDNKVQVLIHGIYKGTDCWYRLDMIKNEQQDEISKVTRNYRYIFKLQNVNFLGRTKELVKMDDPDNKPFNAHVMTLSADEASILDITTDDEWFLGVNSSTLQLEQNSTGLCFTKFKILTNNFTQGWNIVDAPYGVSFNPGTIGGTASSDENRKVSTVWIYINRNIITSGFKFYVTTGKIRKEITVSYLK
ncbi:hypothetical protein [Bacteroides bouchesdurhonensis]